MSEHLVDTAPARVEREGTSVESLWKRGERNGKEGGSRKSVAERIIIFHLTATFKVHRPLATAHQLERSSVNETFAIIRRGR